MGLWENAMSVECIHCGNMDHDSWCPKHVENIGATCTRNPISGEVFHQQGCGHLKKTEFNSVKDSGERREFSTGSVRDVRTGKGRYDLIPPYSLRRLAQHYENGAAKYGDRNWEKGQPAASYVDSLIRHGQDYLSGDRSEDHMAAVAWNAFAIMWTLEMVRLKKFPESFDDLPLPMTDITPDMPF